MEPKCHVVKVCAGPNFMHSDCLSWIVYNNEVDKCTARGNADDCVYGNCYGLGE